MIYTNLLLFLAAIFLFSVATVPDTPFLPPYQGLPLMAVLYLVYSLLATWFFGRMEERAGNYFRTEKLLSVLALCFFGATLYFCDPKYYLRQFSFQGTVPALVNIVGLLLFVAYLALMWRAGRRSYEMIFGRKYTVGGFVVSNLKANLPIVIPWLVLSLFYDVVALLPFTGLKEIVASQWGDLLLFGVFLVFILLFFPPLVRRLWGCKKMPEGQLKQQLDAFCAKQGFNADFYLWPLFEGRVLTAGVMGIVPGLRYILITPALIETMSMVELEAVMAHEIGHVKKRHLLLYVLLIGGFSLLAGVFVEPAIFLVLSFDLINNLILQSGISVENMFIIVGAVPLLFFMLFYFRFIFGYFIRNFERQADLFSLSTMGSSKALVSAFEKIAELSGDIRDKPNWHHFSIGQRIDCLRAAEKQPYRITVHNKKVRRSLFAYVAVIVLSVFGVNMISTDALIERYHEKTLLLMAAQEPEHVEWQIEIGNLMLRKKEEKKALEAYEKAFGLDPSNAKIMNSIARLLLTSEDLALRDPLKALTLARGAVAIRPKGYILDTLATAYWANDLVEEAVRLERQAAAVDAANRRFYLTQVLRFTTQTYEESLEEQMAEQNAGEG